MRGVTTEYRESYCWIKPCKSRRGDNYDDMIRKKIDGTYDEDENGYDNNGLSDSFDGNGMNSRNKNGNNGINGHNENGKSNNGFIGLSLEDCLPDKTPKPKDKSPVPTPMTNGGNANNTNGNGAATEEKPKSFGRKSLISKKKSKKASQEFNDKASSRSGSSFCNFGQGNSTRLNPKFNYTTYNVQAGDGINPNTLIRTGCRGIVRSKYSKPLDSQSVHMYRPEFFTSVNDAPDDIKEELQGPFWVSWPENTPLPDEYIELKPVLSL